MFLQSSLATEGLGFLFVALCVGALLVLSFGLPRLRRTAPSRGDMTCVSPYEERESGANRPAPASPRDRTIDRKEKIAMKLDVRAVALASGTVAAALYALCTLFVALAPEATVWATRELFHLAVSSPPAITWIGVVSGLLFWFLGTAVAAAAFAALHNRWVHG